jgi:hypothetical protein
MKKLFLLGLNGLLSFVASRLRIPWITVSSLQAGLLWAVYQLMGGLLPLWGTWIFLTLVGKQVDLYGFLKNGEFVLYAASLIGGGLFSLRSDFFPIRNWLNAVLMILLAICLLVFTTVTAFSSLELPQSIASIQPDILTRISVVVFGVAALATFGITIAEAGGAAKSISERLKRGLEKMEKDLDERLGEGGQE